MVLWENLSFIGRMIGNEMVQMNGKVTLWELTKDEQEEEQQEEESKSPDLHQFHIQLLWINGFWRRTRQLTSIAWEEEEKRANKKKKMNKLTDKEFAIDRNESLL